MNDEEVRRAPEAGEKRRTLATLRRDERVLGRAIFFALAVPPARRARSYVRADALARQLERLRDERRGEEARVRVLTEAAAADAIEETSFVRATKGSR